MLEMYRLHCGPGGTLDHQEETHKAVPGGRRLSFGPSKTKSINCRTVKPKEGVKGHVTEVMFPGGLRESQSSYQRYTQ